MPSSYTPSLRLEKQAAGENTNTWGDTKLNNVIQRADFSIAGLTTKALTVDYTLTSSNTADDEARAAILKTSGTGAFSVTVPSVSKVYHVWNGCTGTLTITTGAGTTATAIAGEVCAMICDGTNIKKVKPTDFAGSRLTNLADPTGAQDAATKAYADALAFTANAGILPAQTGNSGKFITTDGTTASWAYPTVSSVSDYASDQTTRHNATLATAATAATALAIAFAVAL